MGQVPLPSSPRRAGELARRPEGLPVLPYGADQQEAQAVGDGESASLEVAGRPARLVGARAREREPCIYLNGKDGPRGPLRVWAAYGHFPRHG
jgi:hypothetical protein